MMNRYARILPLSIVALLLTLAILDLVVKKEELFVVYAEQFENEQRTDAYERSHQDVTVTAEGRLKRPREAIKEVALAGANGDITVQRAPGDAIELRYTVRASGSDADAANRRLETVQVSEAVDKGNGRLTFEATSGGKPTLSYAVAIDYVLLLPDAMKLSVKSTDGSVYIDGIKGDVSAVSENGLLDVVGTAGKLSVQASYGSVYVADVSGSVSLDNRHSDTHVESVQGDIAFDLYAGSAFIEDSAGKVSGTADMSAVHLRHIAGPTEVSGDRSRYRLNGIRGDIRVRSASEDITLVLPESGGYALDAAVNGGDIEAQLPLPIDHTGESGFDARVRGVIGDGRWSVRVEAEAGNIVIHRKP